jgi:hypothetical protein
MPFLREARRRDRANIAKAKDCNVHDFSLFCRSYKTSKPTALQALKSHEYQHVGSLPILS